MIAMGTTQRETEVFLKGGDSKILVGSMAAKTSKSLG